MIWVIVMIIVGTIKKIDVNEDLNQILLSIHVHTTNKGEKPKNPWIFTINNYKSIENTKYLLDPSCLDEVFAFFFKDQPVSFKSFHSSSELILENIEKPNVVGNPCPYCLKNLDGFRFEGCDFAYISYYCSTHGFQGNEFDHFDP